MPSFKNIPANWPISITELKARKAEYIKEHSRVNRISNILLFTFLVSQMFLLAWLRPDTKTPDWVYMVLIVFLFSYLLGNVVILIRLNKKTALAFDLACPNCKQLLTTNNLLPIAIATGNCGSCATQIVSTHHTSSNKQESSPASPIVHTILKDGLVNSPMPLKEFSAKIAAYKKAWERFTITLLLMSLPLLGIMCVGVATFQQWLSQDFETPVWHILLPGFILFCFLLWLLLFFSSRKRKTLAVFEIHCPSCTAHLTGPLLISTVVATGNCGMCGFRVVSHYPEQAQDSPA